MGLGDGRLDVGVLALLIPIVAIVGGITVGIVAILTRERTRQMQIRERIAMIEKGLVPPPETDPRGFERAMNVAPPLDDRRYNRDFRGLRRQRSGGIMTIGVGLGFMALNGFQRGLGFGGFLVFIGIAMVISHVWDAQHMPPAPPFQAPTPPPVPPPVPPAGS